MRNHGLLLLAGLGVLVLAVLRWQSPPPAPTAPTAPAAPSATAAAPVAARALSVPPTPPLAAAAADHRHDLALPDGTYVPALNGAVDAAPLVEYWGVEVPYSPIVGVERNTQGVDWYRHANGSYSTTQMVWRSDLQKYVAMTRVGHPGPATTPPTGK